MVRQVPDDGVWFAVDWGSLLRSKENQKLREVMEEQRRHPIPRAGRAGGHKPSALPVFSAISAVISSYFKPTLSTDVKRTPCPAMCFGAEAKVVKESTGRNISGWPTYQELAAVV